MGRRVNKLISILIALAFISTSTNLNYISSYISSDKDALRSMSATNIAGVLEQSLLTTPEPQALLGMPSKASSAGQEIQTAITELVQARDEEYLTAVGSKGTASPVATEGIFTPGSRAVRITAFNGKALIAVNIVSYSQIEGHLRIAQKLGAGIIFEVARSQLGYALDENKTVEYVTEVANRIGFSNPLILHGDHIQYSSSQPEEREVIEGIVERLIKAGFTSIAIDASTIYDEKAGDAVMEYYSKNGTKAEKLVVELEQAFALPLEWGVEFLKLDPSSDKGQETYDTIADKIETDMTKRGRSLADIDEMLDYLDKAFGILYKKAHENNLMPNELIYAYDSIMYEVAEATIAGKLRTEIKPDGKGFLSTSNVEETAHQLQYINELLVEHRIDIHNTFGIEVEVGHIDKKVPNPRRGNAMESKMTHPAAVEVMGKYLQNKNLRFDLIATNNGSGHGTEFNKETLIPVSQVGKISPWLTRELVQKATLFGALIAQHGTSGSDMDELSELSDAGVVKFNIATNYQQIILNVMALWDDGLSAEEVLLYSRINTKEMVTGLNERSRTKIKEWAKLFKDSPASTELEDSDTTFAKFMKLTYSWGAGKKKITADSSQQDIATVLAKEFKRVFKQMDEDLYALGHKASSAGQEIETLKHDAVLNLKQMLVEKGSNLPEVEWFVQRALKVLDKPEPVSLDEAPFTKSGNYKVGFEPTVPILPDITTKTTGLTAVVLTKEGLRGKAIGLDKGIPAEKKQISQIKDQADGKAKRIFETVVEEENTILMVRVSEGFGRDGVEESFKANDVIVPSTLLGETADIRDATDKESSYTSTDGEVYEIAD
ncbi:MAG: class II fructose-bisphosphate aldolase, partial [Candidatus Orphnella occulta]|nr:class II fructose-bisphosphate aldolase [Candidatus Orphnella occulta]